MSRRWAWVAAGGLLLVVFLAIGVWRLSREIPDRMREAEESIRKEAARYGLQVSYRNLKFHLLYPHVSMEDLEVRDARADLSIFRAGEAEVSISPGRLLAGDSPVSRIRLRNFALHLEDANRPLIDRLREEKGGGSMPEIVLLGGTVRIGPFGPVKRWQAKITEFRVREVRFLGTRITLRAEEATGETALPGVGGESWPFASVDADLFHHEGAFRVRRLRASGPSASFKMSGLVEPGRRSADVDLSGEVNLERWMSSGAPGGPWLARFADKGDLVFSATLKGTADRPGGSGKLLLRRGVLKGGTAAEADFAARVENRKLRIDSLKGRILDGEFTGSGSWALDSGTVDGTLALRRMAFGAAPWKEWGIAWRPAGAGDADVALSGGKDRIRVALSLKNPAGLESVYPDAKGAREAIRLPLSLSAAGEYVRGKGGTLSEFRARFGLAEVAGGGEIAVPSMRLRFAGKFSAPRGGTSEYGWNAPVSWESVSGEWSVEGEAASPRITARLETRDLSVRGLPPVPLVVKVDGTPADRFHFVADIPANFAKATVAGTFTGPISGKPFLVDASIGAREVDFAEGGKWIAGVVAVLRKDAGGAVRYLSAMKGTGNADLRVSVGKDALSVGGTLRSGDFRLAGIEVRDLLAEGEWNRSGPEESWSADARGRMKGEGEFLLEGEGSGGSASVSGRIGGLEIGSALELLGPGSFPPVRGTASLRFSSRYAGKAWVLDSLSASAPRLSIDNAVLGEVSVEGSMGPASGRFDLVSRRPDLKLAAQVGRGGDWPVSFRFTAAGVPADFVLSAAGHPGIGSTGSWNASAEGVLKAGMILAGKTFPPDSIAALRFSATSSASTISEMDFGEIRIDGRKEGDAISGEIVSRSPDSRLSCSVTLREPFGFRLEGPVSVATGVGKGKEGRTRFSLDGRIEVTGALTDISRATGVLEVRRFSYKDGGIDLSGKEISARLLPEGIRWTGGTILAAGNPLRISGKTSWGGDLDLHVGGLVPAAAIRLVTDVFDRLDGTMNLDLRLTGNVSDPVLVGTGRLENGLFSFRGYEQLFESMQADAIISREKILFEHFEGKSGGGYIDGRGELPLRFDAHQRLFFSVDFFDMRFPYPEEFRPVLEGHIELLGPYDDFLVTGEVEVQDARYTKQIRLEKLPIDFRRRLVDVTARKETSDFRVRLDVDGVADGTIRIKNNLADAVVKGEFKVVGDVTNVIVLGAFDVIEGTVEYQGNKYDLKRVSVDFQDPRRNNPRLDARAETTKGDVTVAVTVTGTLDKYEVDMSSEPPLSKNDIVSLLSLGVTSAGLAGSEGTVSAAAASSLVLGPYKGKVEEGIRGFVQLDKFAIEPSFSTSTKTFEPKFIVGKSFGDRFSVSVSSSVGTSSESNAVAEYKLLENVFLQGAWESATTEKEGDLGADVKVRYRYRRFKDFLRGRE